MQKIIDFDLTDNRVPTSENLLGSDFFHIRPNYLCIYTSVKLDNRVD